MRNHSQHNNDEGTQFFRKIYLSQFIRKGCERVMCERWAGDWTETATYWPPVPPSFAALLSRSAGLLNRGSWRPSTLLSAGSHCLELTLNWLQTNWTSCRNITLSQPFHCLALTCFPLSVASAPNSTRPQSRLYPDIFDRMHLFLDRRLDRRSICYISSIFINYGWYFFQYFPLNCIFLTKTKSINNWIFGLREKYIFETKCLTRSKTSRV